MPLILMRIFEQRGQTFDWWMSVLTRGNIDRVREEIVHSTRPGERVLEIGCGTGALALQMAASGANVVAIDKSAEMIAVAERSTEGARVELVRLSALEIEDRFARHSFDRIVAVLTFSELASAERDCVLRQCLRVLTPSGELVLADETEPESRIRRWFFRILRLPARLIVFLVSQATDLRAGNVLKAILYYIVELPLMVLTFAVVPPATRPLLHIDAMAREAGFNIATSKAFMGGLFGLWSMRPSR